LRQCFVPPSMRYAAERSPAGVQKPNTGRFNVLVHVGGAIYVVYKHIYMGGGDRALLPSSITILAVGVAKYVERVLALWQGNLGNIRSSSKKKKKKKRQRRRYTDGSGSASGTVLDNEQALMVAHDMFPFCQRAMTDSSVNMDSSDLEATKVMFSFGWESMCKVVEMELSLMYDILYTKAAMVHTWVGYSIRLGSPVATFTALVLFLLYSKDGQRRALMHGRSAAAAHAKAIKALSEYLMFLVAVRRHMLPGLVLRSLYEVTFDALQDIGRKQAVSSRSTTTGREREGKLARTLRDKMDADGEWGLDHDKTRLVSDGANIAMALLEADESEMPEVLELVFNVWVDKLLYAGTRCSRESHARQLSRGGELTTVVWILAQHVGPFQIGQCVPDDKKRDLPPPCPLPVPKAMEEPYPPPFMMYLPPSTAPWLPSPQYVEPPKKEEPCPPPFMYPPPSTAPWPPLPESPLPPPPPPMERRRRYATLYPVD
uniref:DUF4220 domain-containing protein n=6 Tax=Triticinae TaxID=1648030 RepID=A0A453ABY1_AEGTS